MPKRDETPEQKSQRLEKHRQLKELKIKQKEDMRKAVLHSNEMWRKLSPTEQLAKLDEKFGKNQGATKQRKRIYEKIQNLTPESKNDGV